MPRGRRCGSQDFLLIRKGRGVRWECCCGRPFRKTGGGSTLGRGNQGGGLENIHLVDFLGQPGVYRKNQEGEFRIIAGRQKVRPPFGCSPNNVGKKKKGSEKTEGESGRITLTGGRQKGGSRVLKCTRPRGLMRGGKRGTVQVVQGEGENTWSQTFRENRCGQDKRVVKKAGEKVTGGLLREGDVERNIRPDLLQRGAALSQTKGSAQKKPGEKKTTANEMYPPNMYEQEKE